MIAGGDVRKLEVALDVRAVLIERGKKFEQRLFSHLWRRQKERESGEQIHRAQRNFHRAVPVHAQGDRILRSPARELAKELRAECFIAGDRVRAPQRDEMPKPIQLPNNARIRAIAADQIDVGMIGSGPVKAR